MAAKLNCMGRFATTVEFYSRYREPYTPQFFATAAQQLAFKGNEELLDVGCGPGLLAIGFAPFVAHCTAIDPEPAMLSAATKAAAETGGALTFHQSRIEDFSTMTRFDIITIGRALHWLDRPAALAQLDQLLAPAGRMLICGASSVEGEPSPWHKRYTELRHAWASDDEIKHHVDAATWFAGSAFIENTNITVTELRLVTIAELIGRALSKSNTSPAVLGEHRMQFDAEVTAGLEPFVRDGVLQEQIVARARVFERPR
jgi:SAM-dependent methyltransferase